MEHVEETFTSNFPQGVSAVYGKVEISISITFTFHGNTAYSEILAIVKAQATHSPCFSYFAKNPFLVIEVSLLNLSHKLTVEAMYPTFPTPQSRPISLPLSSIPSRISR